MQKKNKNYYKPGWEKCVIAPTHACRLHIKNYSFVKVFMEKSIFMLYKSF